MSENGPGWTFLSNHAHVLICIGRLPAIRVRDIADQVGITERAVLRILAELEEAGVVVRARSGRRTEYSLDLAVPLRHPMESGHPVGDLVRPFLLATSPREKKAKAKPAPRRRTTAGP